MSPEQIFAIANLTAAAAWLLLAVLPRQRWVTTIVTGTAVPAFFAAAYIAIIASRWSRSTGGFSTLAGVSTLFSNPWLLLAGWLHYLAFDLLAGTWEVRDARERGFRMCWSCRVLRSRSCSGRPAGCSTTACASLIDAPEAGARLSA